MTELDAVVVRDGKNIKGRLLGLVLGIFGKRVLGKELAKTVKAIEALKQRGESSETRLDTVRRDLRPMPVARAASEKGIRDVDHNNSQRHDRPDRVPPREG